MPSHPEGLIDLPELKETPGGDLLSRALGRIRLSGERVEVLTLEPGTPLHAGRVPGGCVFVLAAGGAVLRDPAKPEVRIGAGELVLLIEGLGARMVEAGATGAELLLCRFRVDAAVLRGMELALPVLVHIGREQGASWIDGISGFIRLEAGDEEPGATLMVSRLIDLVVIRALRTWAQGGGTAGWLSGTADPRIARVLVALHAEPANRWSLHALAQLAGMSRSSFCDRFSALVGQPPLRYQNALRLGAARVLLGNPEVRIGAVAEQVGYGSEAAFSRAYKAMFGRSPVRDREA
jgi:AraC-like DNA-binding protein